MPRADTTPKGPGGRPKKLDTERRIERSECRLTLAEKQFVRDQAKLAGITEAEYARRRLLGMPVVARTTQADARLVHELNAIGVNLNQIARNQNAGRVGAGAVDLDDLMRQLRATLDQAVDALDD